MWQSWKTKKEVTREKIEWDGGIEYSVHTL